ncbi:MAG TPA: acyl-CoA thioesterase [Methylomirabilota bacterium]|jgi:YbgC/YbaW family acyl-CoA thioester hydrolase
MAANTTTVRVRWSDADPAGIAFYPRFFEWYDLGTEALFEAIGLPWLQLFPRHGIVGVPIVESGSTFAAPVRYGDTVTIRSTVAWVKDKTFRMEHEISVGDTVCARGFEIRAWVLRPSAPGQRLGAGPIPQDIARRLTGGQAAGA